jgi:hypothetical protein
MVRRVGRSQLARRRPGRRRRVRESAEELLDRHGAVFDGRAFGLGQGDRREHPLQMALGFQELRVRGDLGQVEVAAGARRTPGRRRPWVISCAARRRHWNINPLPRSLGGRSLRAPPIEHPVLPARHDSIVGPRQHPVTGTHRTASSIGLLLALRGQRRPLRTDRGRAREGRPTPGPRTAVPCHRIQDRISFRRLCSTSASGRVCPRCRPPPFSPQSGILGALGPPHQQFL